MLSLPTVQVQSLIEELTLLCISVKKKKKGIEIMTFHP